MDGWMEGGREGGGEVKKRSMTERRGKKMRTTAEGREGGREGGRDA
jgi:hypothetical protein